MFVCMVWWVMYCLFLWPNDNIHHVNTVPLITIMDAWLTGLKEV